MNERQDAASPSLNSDDLVDIAIEGWRFARVFVRLLSKIDDGDSKRYANQARYFLKRIDAGLEKCDLRIVNLEGQIYETGMATSALNISDFGPEDTLVIDQMVEPVIMGQHGLVRAGTVMLAKVSSK